MGGCSPRVSASFGSKESRQRTYGIAVAEGKIDLNETLAQLNIDDRQPLTAAEKAARVRDLISSRSGVFLPAAYAPSDQDAERPPRGSHPPGTHWFYNNWDFNVAGVVYEQRTGEKLYESFRKRIAAPTGMQDFAVDDGMKVMEPSLSNHPAHTFRMSTRDLARFGQLYLQRGKWEGRQIVPESWISESTRPVTEMFPGQGYGYMWWTYAVGGARSSYPTLRRYAFYQARGTGGQVMFVIPEADLVIVERGDTDNNRTVGANGVWAIAERIIAAKKSDARAAPRLVAMQPAPFVSQAPVPVEPRFVTLDRSALDRLAGSYAMAPNMTARVFLFEGRPFMFFPGQGEAELFALSPTEFTIKVQAGVRVAFETDAAGNPTAVVVQLGPQTMRGTRIAAPPASRYMPAPRGGASSFSRPVR